MYLNRVDAERLSTWDAFLPRHLSGEELTNPFSFLDVADVTVILITCS